MAIDFNWAQSGTSNGTSAQVDAGAINPNDLLIAVVVPETGAFLDPGAVVAPPGWVQLDNAQLLIDNGLPATAAVFYKVADGSESSNFTFTWSNSAACSWALVDYSGVDPTSPIDAFAGQTNSSGYSNNTTAPSVTTTGADDTLVNIWVTKGGTEGYAADPSTTMRVSSDSATYAHPEIMVADKQLSSAGPTGPDVMTETYGTINQRGFSIALKAAACFMAGTKISTPEGEVPVETIVPGQLVTTADGRAEKVSWVGRQTVSMLFADPLRVLPIRIKAGALGENEPSRDLRLSPDHAILVEQVLIQAGALVNGTTVVRDTSVPLTFTYYHVELEDHSLILAEGTPAETFIDNVDRLAFDNWKEHEALYPDGKPIVEMPYPRAKAHRQVPQAVRDLLAERAAILMDGTEDVAAA